MIHSRIITKREAAEYIFRPQLGHGCDEAINRCILKNIDIPDPKFIIRFRRSTGLNLCSFAPNLFIIRY